MTQDFTEQNRSLTLGKGVNTDFTATEVNKVAYDKGFYIAFHSTRQKIKRPAQVLRKS